MADTDPIFDQEFVDALPDDVDDALCLIQQRFRFVISGMDVNQLAKQMYDQVVDAYVSGR